MFESLFKPSASAHLKRAEIMLHEANMARVEHQAAAEHHGALAQMYAERVNRLEHEVYGARAKPWRDEPLVQPAAQPVLQTPAPSASEGAAEKVRHYAFGDRRLERG